MVLKKRECENDSLAEKSQWLATYLIPHDYRDRHLLVSFASISST
jgi:hypothetical protein